MKKMLWLVPGLFSAQLWASDCDSRCQLAEVSHYFKALDQVSRAGSTAADIDRLLEQLAPDVQYIHSNYQAHFDKASWRSAFLRNLKRGACTNGPSQQQRVLRSIPGTNFMAVEYAHGVLKPDGSWQAEQPLLVLFGFHQGKISLVQELW